MATWKEKGVVPDSDDDDDDVLNSQNTATGDNHINGQQPIDEPDDIEASSKHGDKEYGEDGLEIESLTTLDAATPLNIQETTTLEYHSVQSTPRFPEISAPREINLNLPPISPGSNPKVFKTYALDEEEELPFNDQVNLNSSNPQESTAEDEISKSYVRISSPSLGFASSSANQPNFPSYLRLNSQTEPSPSRERLPSTAEYILQVPRDPSPLRRSLRQRNAIQLHPYALESAKYRQELNECGIAPIRIANSSQEEPHQSQDTTSPDLDFQEPESQDLDSQEVDAENIDSELMDIDWNDLPSSPPPIITDNGNGANALDEDTAEMDVIDEEFPDIDKLLGKRQSSLGRTLGRTNAKPRLKSYSKKSRGRLPSSTLISSTKKTLYGSAIRDVFDAPASPPPTSSPFSSTSLRNKSPISRALSNSSKRSIPMSLPHDEVLIASAQNVLTPVTSAIKPVSQTILINSDSESDDPFASDRGETTSASSSSEDSVQIRRIGKRIRGVLPASHLRLEQKKMNAPGRPIRNSMSMSPMRGHPRRGVALPRTQSGANNTPDLIGNGMSFLSGDSGEEEDDDPAGFGVVMNNDNDMELEGFLDESHRGIAEEYDTIDAMLPPRKRQSTSSNKRPHKRKRLGSGLFQGERGDHERQPRITEHLEGPVSKPQRKTGVSSRKKRTETKRHNHRLSKSSISGSLPRLSILDVADLSIQDGQITPQFMRIAVRAARSRKGRGKQSPSRKFIRLANRDDTQDANLVLEDWKDGKIKPKPQEEALLPHSERLRIPLSRIENSKQMRLPAPLSTSHTHGRTQSATLHSPRTLMVPRKQSSIHQFVTTGGQHIAISLQQTSNLRAPKTRLTRPRYNAPVARPAQLESSEDPYSQIYSGSTLKTKKRALDVLYRSAQKRPVQQRNIPLSRFLADEDIALPSIEAIHHGYDDNFVAIPKKPSPDKIPWRKKKPPRRLDTGAATYRQPSNPLILDFLTPEQSSSTVNSNMLRGLGKFGTNYTISFDVFPLMPGTFFHQSTFIGSGRLAAAIKSARPFHEGTAGSCVSLNLDNREFSWGCWDETVSSEMGICFDWLADQLLAMSTTPYSPGGEDAVMIMTSISDYFQNHLRFVNPLAISEFLFRMVDILQDFSARLDGTSSTVSHSHLNQIIAVSAVCTSLLLQLLQVARDRPECSSIAYQLEDLLKMVASQCVGFSLRDGLEDIRKLYDDLQYLSFRENGIKGECYATEALVIVIKVLNAANIPRGSFWDITNPHLASIPIKDINDAPKFEKLWYYMYSLLPLSEFDESGIVVSGLRQVVVFDNWSLVQQILKKVFQMYELNPRQSPGFNDYCRSMVGRCHYLMVEWGWWKGSSLIGTLFDIFASHDLANLRNEEVYASPRFLGELNTQPSLSVEPEDRCFHIFLKMVALQLKHFKQINDIKSIRNLVPRLLPNHTREYPKEREIHQRDLACLRNQHDLLSTLYWAAPSAQRPTISLLQTMVIADRSHQEACLINLRAWQHLSRFVVTSSESSATYSSFRIWHSTMLQMLIQSYQRTEQDTRQQAENIPSMFEGAIIANIEANKKAIASQICAFLKAQTSILGLVQNSEMLKEFAGFDLIQQVLGLCIHENIQKSADYLLSECQDFYVLYMSQVNNLCPTKQLQVELIEPLLKQVLPFVRLLVRKCLEKDHDNSSKSFSVEGMVNSFARLVYHVTRLGKIPLADFLLHGENAVFENRDRFQLANNYWPYFLESLLKLGDLNDFKLPNFDIGKEWLLTIIQPLDHQHQKEILRLKGGLSNQLQIKGHYFLTGINLSRSSFLSLVRSTIRRMKSFLLQNNTQAELGLPRIKAEKLFSDTLEEMMKLSQRYLEDMIPHSDMHARYLEHIQAVIRDIRCYASDFRPLIEFFVRPSRHYWADQSDPGLVGSGLRSYAVRIHGNRKTTSFELFYYLFNDWKNAIVSGKMRAHQNAIRSAMRQEQFADYMFREFIPAVLFVSSDIKGGWLLCASYLPTISDTIIAIGDDINERSDKLFEQTTNLLKLVMRAITELTWQHQSGIGGVSPQHRGLLAVVFSFYFSIARFVNDYADNKYLRNDTSPPRVVRRTELRNVMSQIDDFIKQTRNSFADPDEFEFWPPDEEDRNIEMGEFGEEFVNIFKEDIKTLFSFRDGNGFDVVVLVKGQNSAVQTHDTLAQVLEKKFLPNPYIENRFIGFFPTAGCIL